ncbi:MAG: mechanosensitive ion channel family protein, partial [Cytophagales bacterium]|nr:mechanosensitive ion channel family protein [Cytophagales bacterium]
EMIEDHGDFHPDSLFIRNHPLTTDIFYGHIIIQSISEADAAAEKKTVEQVANEHLAIIKNKIDTDIHEQSPEVLAKEIGMALIASLILCVLILLINRLYKKFLLLKVKKVVGILQGVRIGKYDILSANMEKKLAMSILGLLKSVLILFLVYIFLLVIFYIFPWTKSYSFKLFDFMASPLKRMAMGAVHFLPDLFTILVIYWIAKYVVKFFHFFFIEVERGNLKIPGFYRDWAKPTYSIVRFFLYVTMFIVIFPYLPFSDSPAFHGVSVFLGILFSFGSSSSISNIISGLVITYMRPFQIGDRVKIDEIVGDIVHKNLLVTRIKTIKNEDIAVPNSILLNSHTINYSTLAKEKGLIIHTSVTIGYDTPWKTVHELLIKAAENTSGTLKTPPPFVLQTALNDFYVEYQINVYTNDANNMHNIEAELHKQIQESFFEHGVEIMSPHYYSLRDGNTVSIPEAKRPPNYEPGFFRFFNQGKK